MARNAQQSAPWDPITQPVDKIRLSGVDSPGLCEITGAGSPRKWDEVESAGWSGGAVIYHGIRLSHFTVNLYLYDPQDWIDWDRFRPLVMRAPMGSLPRTHTIWHPVLAEVGIAACVVEDVKAPVQVDDGVWLIEIPMIESRIPKKGAVVKPTGADASTEDDPRERLIDQLLKVRDALANEGNP